MKLTKRSEYGLKAVMDLATSPDSAVMPVPRIARAHGISLKFLEQILTDLRRAGIVHSRKGRRGGYVLARPPEQVTVGEVVGALDDTFTPASCLSDIAARRCVCPDEAHCALRLITREVREAILDVLNHISVADLLQHSAHLTTPGLTLDNCALAGGSAGNSSHVV